MIIQFPRLLRTSYLIFVTYQQCFFYQNNIWTRFCCRNNLFCHLLLNKQNTYTEIELYDEVSYLPLTQQGNESRDHRRKKWTETNNGGLMQDKSGESVLWMHVLLPAFSWLPSRTSPSPLPLGGTILWRLPPTKMSRDF